MNYQGNCPDVSLHFEKIGRIGHGTYGVVYKAKDRRTKEIVALKRVTMHHEVSDGFPITSLREIQTLRELHVHNHPNVVKFLEVAVSKSRNGVFLVFEYCEHDLADLVDAHYSLHRKSPFRESEVKRLALQLLSALAFLHSRYIMHRDIKLSNVLYNHHGHLKLADFGLARKACFHPEGDINLTTQVVSLWYRPPEILLGCNYYDNGIDNYATGCVIAELLLGQPLIKGTSEIDQISKIFQLLGPPTSSTWPGFYQLPMVQNGTVIIPSTTQTLLSSGKTLLDRVEDLSAEGIALLSNLLKYDISKRMKASEAIRSDYFQQLPLPTNPCLMPTFPTKH